MTMRERKDGISCLILAVLAVAMAAAPSATRAAGDYLRVDAGDRLLECTAYAGPGDYSFGEPLRIAVESSLSGWRLRMKALPLQDAEGNEIPASAVRAMVEEQWVPLGQAVTVLACGDAGRQEVDVPIALVTEDYHPPGVYEGELCIGAEHPTGCRAPIARVPVRVSVGSRVEHSASGNRIYFHYGLPGEPVTATVRGRVDAEMAVCLVLSAAEGRVDSLPVRAPMSSRAPQDARAPIAWRLAESAEEAPRPPDTASSDGSEVGWRLRETPGRVEYELHCTLSPEAAQPPGEYVNELTLNVVPVLEGSGVR